MIPSRRNLSEIYLIYIFISCFGQKQEGYSLINMVIVVSVGGILRTLDASADHMVPTVTGTVLLERSRLYFKMISRLFSTANGLEPSTCEKPVFPAGKVAKIYKRASLAQLPGN